MHTLKTLEEGEASQLLQGARASSPGPAAAGLDTSNSSSSSTSAEPTISCQLQVVDIPQEDAYEQGEQEQPEAVQQQRVKLLLTYVHAPAAAAGERAAAGKATTAAGSGAKGAVGAGFKGLGSLGALMGVGGNSSVTKIGGGGAGSRRFGQKPGAKVGEQGATVDAAAAAGEAGGDGAKVSKKKKLSWKRDSDLLSVRWFFREDPPVKVSEEGPVELRAWRGNYGL